jgi:RNA polymerase sigma factor (sigma-70 family)
VEEGWLQSAEDVYRKYADDLTRFATGLVGPSDAGDVVSGALLACVTSRGWGEVQDHRAYLHRAVLNQARHLRRSSRRRTAREQRTAGDVSWAEPRQEVLDAVSRLSLRQRGVIVLTYWADLSPPEIADRLGISEGSVRRHLARARANLRKVLDD